MKKIKIIITIILFILSIFIHFGYSAFPNYFTSIFFPINESIFEHMKIIYTGILIVTIIEYFIYKNKGIKFNNLLLSIPIVSIIGISIYLSLYMLIDIFIPHNLIISVILLFLIFILCEVLSYNILKMENIKHQRIIGIVLIIISYVIFTYLSYNPPKNDLFFDTSTKTYGIKNKNKL